ncbi:Uncharacterized protein SCG7086_BD_00050 [Chlamydiales bacterium SCGC AG-110-P3]|nr:Uncharacterized protein SCG7086_BD_00050 [Chlamydiales bacterium SCGC AG-110-P3]
MTRHSRFRKLALITLVATSMLTALAHAQVTTENLSEELIEEVFNEGVTVDLRHPIYSDGVLTTTEGGVVTGPNLRIQARHIVYTRKVIDGEDVFRLEADGDLMVEYNGRVFVGEQMEYNFATKEGYVYSARGAIVPWYFGGDTIHLLTDGSFIIYEGYITTSENRSTEWQIRSSEVRIYENSLLHASNVQFRFVNLPLFWIPTYRANLKTMWRMPIRYHARWSGRLGPRVGMSYLLMSWDDWEAFLLLDYSFRRGLGGGLETIYEDPSGPRRFYTRNYVANDNSVEEPNRRERYRFSGQYQDEFPCGLSVTASYDKLSDKYMADDYYQRGFDSQAIGRSQIAIQQRTCDWIATLFVHARFNEFQSVKQQLPTLSLHVRPWDLFCSGIISDTKMRGSYLNFRYDEDLLDISNFSSARCELGQRLYRPFNFGAATVTPEIGATAIYYSNGPPGHSAAQVVGTAALQAEVPFYRTICSVKHTVTPYVRHEAFSASSEPVVDHYLFDIDDGWHDLNMTRFGIRNAVYSQGCHSDVKRRIFADLYANAFFTTRAISQRIPYVHLDAIWDITDCVRSSVSTAWDIDRRELRYYNTRLGYTASAKLAFAVELRHRSNYAWRKADSGNYFLDVFLSESELRQSNLSDQRNAAIGHIYYQYLPTWALELQSRFGWNRLNESSYSEFQADLHGHLRGGWILRLSYQRRENDDRFAINIGLGAKPPSRLTSHPVSLYRGNY